LFELIVRIGFSLLVVLALMWLLARATRKKVGGRNGDALSVISRQSLSRGSSIAVVKVADRALVVGVTESQVTLLAETDLLELERQLDTTGKRDAVPLEPDAAGVAVAVPARTAALPKLGRGGALDGSLLSGKTWRTAMDFLRERTARS
jgi:flagellar protein FliO/FliZ